MIPEQQTLLILGVSTLTLTQYSCHQPLTMNTTMKKLPSPNPAHDKSDRGAPEVQVGVKQRRAR